MRRATLARVMMTTLCTAALLATAHPVTAGYWLNAGPKDTDFLALSVAASSPSTLYAAGNTLSGSVGAVFKSTDFGANWTVAFLNSDTSGSRALAVDPTNPANVFYGGYGVSKTTDGGQTWGFANNGITGSNFYVFSIAIDPAAPSTVYAGVSSIDGGNGVYKTVDGGANWAAASAGLPPGADFKIASLTIAPTTPSTLYAAYGGVDGVFKSTNAGGSWVPAGLSGGDTFVTAVAVDPVTSTTVYAGGSDSGGSHVFKSTDAGGSWLAITVGSASDLAISTSDPSTIYAAGSFNGVFRSTNAGANWMDESSGLANPTSPIPSITTSVAIDPTHPNAVYAGAFGSALGNHFGDGDGGGSVLFALCNELPHAGCKLPTATKKATIQLTDKLPDKGDLLSWTWTKGAATTKAEFGDPTTTTDYNVCVYDSRTGTPGIVLGARLLSGRMCGTKPCWKATKTGFKYTDSKSALDGVTSLVLTEGAAGKAKIALKAKGASVFMPTLPVTTAVTVQLVNSAGACWEATYSANVTKNDAGQFKAKSD